MSALTRLENGPLLFTAATESVSGRGSPSTTFDPIGVTVLGYVESERIAQTQPDGLVMAMDEWHVHLFADPATLNGGEGVRQDDGFLWRGLRLVAQGPPREMKIGTRLQFWRVDCQLKV